MHPAIPAVAGLILALAGAYVASTLGTALQVFGALAAG